MVVRFAPITGAWIETAKFVNTTSAMPSHPSRVRGLKREAQNAQAVAATFAPITGAWIETLNIKTLSWGLVRTHHGCVD
tara:strand:- start:119 stop:355 length:237 start_codon:yes stop_codon:yes gene_type:complete